MKTAPAPEAKKDDGWVSITRAAVMLKIRYLKCRDLMTQGLLGDVRETRGRYYVKREAVEKYLSSRN